MGSRAGLDRCRKSRPPTGIRSPDYPVRSQSLYRLRYHGLRNSTVLMVFRTVAVVFHLCLEGAVYVLAKGLRMQRT